MNPLLNQNLFMLRTIHAKKTGSEKFAVVNEFEGFSSIVENEMAVKIFSLKEENRKERVRYARDLLIKMIGKEEFLRLKTMYNKNAKEFNKLLLQSVLNQAEIKLFKLIAKGFKQIEIAELLEWSVDKVQYHKKSIYRKLNFNHHNDLLEYASKNRLI